MNSAVVPERAGQFRNASWFARIGWTVWILMGLYYLYHSVSQQKPWMQVTRKATA